MAVLEIIERDELIENAARQGEYLLERLRLLAETEPLIGDVRGKGAAHRDRARRRPRDQAHRFDAALGVTQRLHALARARGVMIYPGAGGDGAGDQILITPPLIVTREDVDLIVDRPRARTGRISTLELPDE